MIFAGISTAIFIKIVVFVRMLRLFIEWLTATFSLAAFAASMLLGGLPAYFVGAFFNGKQRNLIQIARFTQMRVQGYAGGAEKHRRHKQ